MLCPTDLNRTEHYSSAQSIVLLHRPYSTTAALLPALHLHVTQEIEEIAVHLLSVRKILARPNRCSWSACLLKRKSFCHGVQRIISAQTIMSDHQYKDWKSATELACLADPTLNCEATSRTFPLGRVCNLLSESTTECHFKA